MRENYREIDDHLFDVDPLSGIRQRLKIDNEGRWHLQTMQDVDSIVNYAHELRSNYCRNERLGDVAKVGSIPMLVMFDLIKRGIWYDPVRRRKWWRSIEAAPYTLRDIQF